MASPRPSLTSTASVESSGDDVSDSGSFRSPLPQRWPRPPPPPPEPKSTTTVTVDSLHVDKHASMPGILNGTFNKTTVMTFLVPGGGPSHDLDPATLDHMVTDAVRINQETLESFVPSSKGADADAIAVKLPGTKEQVEGLSRRWCCLISALVVLSLVTLLGTGVLSLASWRTSRSPVKAATEATIELLSAEEKHFATLPGGPPLITRPRWLAAAPAAPLDRNTLPVSLVIVCHTATTSCHSEPQCIDSTRSVQWFHQNSRHWADVGYNFLVGGDGSVYWGRGFDFMGSHTKGFNNGSIAVAFIGTYLDIVPSKEQVEAFDKLMTMGVRGGKIAEDYTLVAQCQLKVTAAPGLALVEEMKSWPHFNSSLPVRCTAG